MNAIRSLSVATSSGEPYPVLIGAGLIGEAGRHVAALTGKGRLPVVSDENVWAAQGHALWAGLAEAGIEPVPLIVPPGEGSKSWPTLIRLVDDLIALGVERGGCILAFGGGMVGDLAGFAAAIVKRGIAHVQIPTSLLAQVDSSVGGKTAINNEAGKNLIGAFHQPAAVLIDPLCLETLPERELRAGYAEIVKYGLISDFGFFAWCEANGAALLEGNIEARLHAIETSVRAKAAIVAEDERETAGRRILLNLGHTFAHALEAETGFSDRLLHGEAVAVGMALAFLLSAERGLCPPRDAERVTAHLRSAGLPATLAEAGIDAPPERLAAFMLHDKKVSEGRPRLVLARGIGEAFVAEDVERPEVEDFLSRQA